MAPVALPAVDVLVIAALGFGLLAAAICLAAGSAACLTWRREDPLAVAAPMVLALFPAWAAATLASALPSRPAELAWPAPVAAAGLLLAAIGLWRGTTYGLAARAALADSAAAHAIGMPLGQAGGLMLAAAIIAAAGAGSALATALPDMPPAAVLAVAALAGVARRGALMTAIIAAAFGAGGGAAAIALAQTPPLALATTVVLAASLAHAFHFAFSGDA